MSKTRPEIILEFLKKDPELWQSIYYTAGLEVRIELLTARIEELEGLDRLDEVLVNAGIEQLEAEPRWISVKDRLPENDVSVLVWVRNRYDDCSISIDYVDDGEWWEHDGSRHEALYWMPLPPPPEEKA